MGPIIISPGYFFAYLNKDLCKVRFSHYIDFHSSEECKQRPNQTRDKTILKELKKLNLHRKPIVLDITDD